MATVSQFAHFVWLCPSLSCRKHTIQCMSRFWHQPRWVGKIYASSCFWNMRDDRVKCYCGSHVTVVTFVKGSEPNKVQFSFLQIPCLSCAALAHKSFPQHLERVYIPEKIILNASFSRNFCPFWHAHQNLILNLK